MLSLDFAVVRLKDRFLSHAQPPPPNDPTQQTAGGGLRLCSLETASRPAVCCSASHVTMSGSLRRQPGGRTRLSKTGNAWLRKALYLPTLTAIRFNPILRGFFERLVATGKAKMQAVGACMRKLVMICYGVLKNRKPFDPAYGSRIVT
jgi:hypothetical protein